MSGWILQIVSQDFWKAGFYLAFIRGWRALETIGWWMEDDTVPIGL